MWCKTPGDTFELIVITITFHSRQKTTACTFPQSLTLMKGGIILNQTSWTMAQDSASKGSILDMMFVSREDAGWLKSDVCPFRLQAWTHLDPDPNFGTCYPFPAAGIEMNVRLLFFWRNCNTCHSRLLTTSPACEIREIIRKNWWIPSLSSCILKWGSVLDVSLANRDPDCDSARGSLTCRRHLRIFI